MRRSISDGDGRRIRSRRLRVHLSECPECRHFAELIADRRRDLAALAPPLPVGTAASVLKAVLSSGGGGPGGGGLLAGITGGTGQLAGALTVAKGLAATVVLVSTAAVGQSIEAEPDAVAPNEVAASPAAVVTKEVPARPAPSAPSLTRPGRRRERVDDREQRTRRAPRATPRVTKGIPLDREGPAFQSAPDHAAAAPLEAAPSDAPSDPPSGQRGTAGTTDVVAGLISGASTALDVPELVVEASVPIELPRLDATTLLQTDLLAEQVTVPGSRRALPLIP